jgi:TolA-binding protein
MKVKSRNSALWTYGACVVALVLLGVLPAKAVRGTVRTTEGRIIKADDIRYQRGSYVVTTPKKVQMTLALKQVSGIRIEKPADYDKAVGMVKSGKHSAAIPMLRTIVEKYDMLEWDAKAAKWLAEAYLKDNKPLKTIEIVDKLQKGGNAGRLSGDVYRAYLKALEETKQFDRVKKVLGDMVKTGNRDVAAVAQMKRGDIDMEAGNFKDALVWGYLRTVILCSDYKEIMPEALYKAGECFEKVNRHTHAEKMRKRLLAEYPKSTYTTKLKAEM